MRSLFERRVQPPQVIPVARLLFHADGAISPRAAGAGVYARDEHGMLRLLANRQLPVMTNNAAEYAGLLLVLEIAEPYKRVPIEIRMDSEIVIYQMRGRFAVNSAALKAMHRKACALAAEFSSLTYTHVPREQNRLADALAAEAVMGNVWMVPA